MILERMLKFPQCANLYCQLTLPYKWLKTDYLNIEIVLDMFLKDNPPMIMKPPVEVEIPEWFCMKGLGKEATEHEREIDY